MIRIYPPEFFPIIALALALSLPASAAGQGPEWSTVSAENTPVSAYSAAPENVRPVRICRVRHRKDMEIGMVSDFYCQIGGDGINRPYSIYELLVKAPGVAWAPATNGNLPENALALHSGHGPAIYACRTIYQGKPLVGMVRDKICSTGYQASELRTDEFEVMITN